MLGQPVTSVLRYLVQLYYCVLIVVDSRVMWGGDRGNSPVVYYGIMYQ